jgi:hypothetical protein
MTDSVGIRSLLIAATWPAQWWRYGWSVVCAASTRPGADYDAGRATMVNQPVVFEIIEPPRALPRAPKTAESG